MMTECNRKELNNDMLNERNKIERRGRGGSEVEGGKERGGWWGKEGERRMEGEIRKEEEGVVGRRERGGRRLKEDRQNY